MKKTLKILGITIGAVLLLLAVLPLLFKKQLKAKIEKEIAKQVNAEVKFEKDGFGLSFFRNFPNLTATLPNVSVVNKKPFEGDTLAAINQFRIVLDPFSLMGDKIRIRKIALNEPRIYAAINKDGQANWDITIEQPDDEISEDEEPSEFALEINRWNIENGEIHYSDELSGTKAKMLGVSHSGSGDFTQDLFDLDTKTSVERADLELNGISYLNSDELEADLILNIDNQNSKYTFKENKLRINDFSLGFDGFLSIPDTSSYDMDLKVAAKETGFKNLLSLIPGVYTEEFKNLKTDGTLAFEGFAKGTYADSLYPAFGLDLTVKDGMMQYPDMPDAVKNANLTAKISNPGGNLEQTKIDIKKLHADLGKYPLDAKMSIEGIKNPVMDGTVKAGMNLADLTKLFPVPGMTLKGIFDIDAVVKGTYGGGKMPVMNAKMGLKDGYVKSSKLPAPLENINLNAEMVNTSGQSADTRLSVKQMTMLLEGEPFSANGLISNFDDYTYDIAAKGKIDLEKITKIFPVEGTEIAGKVDADIKAKGKMSDVEAERYTKLANDGTMALSNISYKSDDLPKGMTVKSANLKFDPQKITVSDLDGTIGKSDIRVNGNLSNYMAYLFADDAVLRGNMDLNSNNFDVNEWMTETESSPSSESAKASGEATTIPKNLDFTLNTGLNKVKYKNIDMTDMRGTVRLNKGTATLDRLFFKSLGGSFTANGSYDPRDPKKPKFDMGLNVNEVNIGQAFQAIEMVEKLAPIAQNVTGNFSTDFNISGLLGGDMLPVLTSLVGGGLISLKDAKLDNIPLLNKLGTLIKAPKIENSALKDIVMNAKIRDGRLYLAPYDVQLGNRTFTVDGSTGIDGSMDYNFQTELPPGIAKTLGPQFSKALGLLTGQQPGEVKVGFNVTGSYKSPSVKPKIGEGGLGEGIKSTLEDSLKNKGEEIGEKVKEDLEKKGEEVKDNLKDSLDKKLDNLKDIFGFPKKKKEEE